MLSRIPWALAQISCFYTLSFSALGQGDPFRISGEALLIQILVFHEADSKDFLIPACVVLIGSQGVTDTQTHTSAIAKTKHCMVSYADALYKFNVELIITEAVLTPLS